MAALDPPKFVRDPFSKPVACAPVYPWNFIRTNTIYGVIHAAGGVTAWSDKHAVYAAVSGPTGTSTPSNLTDYYSPEVNSNQIPLPGVTTAGIGEIFYGPTLETMFNAPGVPMKNAPCCALQPGGDPRSPDIIVAPNIGVIYTGSASKQEEHGGFAFDDTNVMLLVSNPSIQPKTVTSWVETMQVAPTILQLLGLDPNSLDAVKMEGTSVLPGLFSTGQGNSNSQGQNQNQQ